MKTSRIIIAAFAAALSLVSCTKENADQKNSSSTSEPRVFTLEFSKQTRTTLGSDGITPEWTNGDKIWISNDQSGEEVSVTVSGDKATITTTLKGTLKAVYPSSAVVKNGSGVISDISVPATQYGTFAESNICMAENIAEGAETITFENKTAVLCFYVDESIGVTKIEIDGTGVATGGNKITVTPLSPNTTLYNVGGGPDQRVCYAAVLPVSGTDITLKGTATTQNQERPISNATLAANTIYNAFIPYYIEVDLGEKGKQKWGYCNVGAFLPEEYGEYFAWGDTEGHEANVLEKTFDYSFLWSNAPFNGGESDYSETEFNKVKGTVCPSGFLASSYDAAKNWGSSWRMPTQDEFTALTDLSSKDWTADYNSTGVKGRVFSDGTNSVFFPAAGSGNGAKLINAGSYGNYWSSSLTADNPIYAYCLGFLKSVVAMGRGNRCYGFSVRPLSE